MSDVEPQGKTGSDVAASDVAASGDGESIPKEMFETMLADSGLMNEDGVLGEVGHGVGASIEDKEAFPRDKHSESDDEEDVSTEWGAPEEVTKDEEDDEDEAPEEAASDESEDEDLVAARESLEAFGLSKEQLEKMDSETILAIGTRVEGLQSGSQSANGAVQEGEQPETASDFDFEERFATVETGLREYLGDEGAESFKGFMSDFKAHMEAKVERAQEASELRQRGTKVIEESMSKLEQGFPKLKGNDRLRKRILANVQDLASTGRHGSDPEPLFRRAALMEGLQERKAEPTHRTSDVLKGQPKSTPKPNRSKPPKTAEAWDKKYIQLRHEDGLTDAVAKRQLGRRPRETSQAF